MTVYVVLHHPQDADTPKVAAVCDSAQLAYRQADTLVAIALAARHPDLSAADTHLMRQRLRQAYTVHKSPLLRTGTQPRPSRRHQPYRQ